MEPELPTIPTTSINETATIEELRAIVQLQSQQIGQLLKNAGSNRTRSNIMAETINKTSTYVQANANRVRENQRMLNLRLNTVNTPTPQNTTFNAHNIHNSTLRENNLSDGNDQPNAQSDTLNELNQTMKNIIVLWKRQIVLKFSLKQFIN